MIDTNSPLRPSQAATALVTVTTAGFAVAAATRPQALSGDPVTPGQVYYARMYAVRAVPLAAAALAGCVGRPNRTVLGVAALAQLGDALIGATRRTPAQVLAPAAAAALYGWQALARH